MHHGYLQLKDDSIEKASFHRRNVRAVCVGILTAVAIIVLSGIAVRGLSPLLAVHRLLMPQEQVESKDQSGVQNLLSIPQARLERPGNHPGLSRPGFHSRLRSVGQYRPKHVNQGNPRQYGNHAETTSQEGQKFAPDYEKDYDMMAKWFKEELKVDDRDPFVEQEKGIGTVEDLDISDAEAKKMCKSVMKNVRLLMDKRDLTAKEIQLTVGMENSRGDPLTDELQRYGRNRDGLEFALKNVMAGSVPKDKVALKLLVQELDGWPDISQPLEEQQKQARMSQYSNIEGIDPSIMKTASEAQESLKDSAGWIPLYLVSAVPIFIGAFVLYTLWSTSFK